VAARFRNRPAGSRDERSDPARAWPRTRSRACGQPDRDRGARRRRGLCEKVLAGSAGTRPAANTDTAARPAEQASTALPPSEMSFGNRERLPHRRESSAQLTRAATIAPQARRRSLPKSDRSTRRRSSTPTTPIVFIRWSPALSLRRPGSRTPDASSRDSSRREAFARPRAAGVILSSPKQSRDNGRRDDESDRKQRSELRTLRTSLQLARI
jgi:hypothetical protein